VVVDVFEGASRSVRAARQDAVSRPVVPLALAVALGAALASQIAPDGIALLLLLCALPIVLALAASRARGLGLALVLSACGITAVLGVLERREYDGAPLRRWVKAHDGSDAPVRLVGRALTDALPDAERFVLLLDVSQISEGPATQAMRGRARIDVGGAAARPRVLAGDLVSVWASLRLPRGVSTPAAFDVERAAFQQGVHAFGYCKSAQLIDSRAGSGLRALMARGRQWARARLQAHVPAGSEQAIVRAMLLGDRSGLDDEAQEAFQAAGTYHVLAISGAQVALLAGLLWSLLRRLGAAPVSVAVVSSALLVGYALLVGGDVPVARATITALIVIWGRTLDLRADWLNLLSAAAVLLLWQRPSAVFDAGFQLSFVATLGVVGLTGRLLPVRRHWVLGLDLALAASVAAQAAVVPILCGQFLRLPLAGLLLNLAAVPLSTAALVSGAGVVLAASVAAPLAEFAGGIAWCVAHALLACSQCAEWLPILDRHVPPPAFVLVALYAAGLVALGRGVLRTRDALATISALAGMVIGVPEAIDGRLHLAMLDVGQGESLVVTSPRGRVWLVDAAGAFEGRSDQGRTVVAPYLWSRGVRRIEGIVITHAHPDHAGGLRYLLEHFDVGEVWEGPAPRGDVGYAALMGRTQGLAHRRTVFRGVSADWDGVRVDVLGPRPPAHAPWSIRNDDSLVLMLNHGHQRLLLTGDVEQRGERDLELPNPPIDVLKVPHHGSRTSSGAAWLSTLAPRIALVSAGFRNRFGHPHPEIVTRYRTSGALLLRTDLDGTLTIDADGRALWLASERAGLRLRLP
jgi:competence protein ComEC